MTTDKRISSNATYQALREALPVVFHYKRPFESFLRSALRDHPELLAGVNFGDLKRYVADEVVQRLVRDEVRYQQITIDLMVAARTSGPQRVGGEGSTTTTSARRDTGTGPSIAQAIGSRRTLEEAVIDQLQDVYSNGSLNNGGRRCFICSRRSFL